MEIDWTAPAAQPRKQKMLDDLRLKCPKHTPRIITAAKSPEYVGRLARQCGCVALVKKTIRTLDAFQQKNKLCWPSVATLTSRFRWRAAATSGAASRSTHRHPP